ncbi:protein artichoke-like [Uloborus diversus]|uniref:protein artichoke-like n=1 Tax=Uloborus diversus TaxID=327109 RepID=UPI002408FE5C|nr:protein artichoke-like [Uloborus diversus]
MNVPSQIAFFFLCLLVLSGASCPEEEDLYPCECEEEEDGVVLNCFGDAITPADVQRALDLMRGVRMEAVELYDIPDMGTLRGDLFEGQNIRKLEINHCDVEALTDGGKPAFSGLENSLEELEIISSLESASSLQLSHLRRLTELDLSYNQLDELKANCFPSSLEYLIVSNNGIKNLDDRVFANLDNLRTLWLDGNVLKTYERAWLPETLNELHDLELDNNHLTSLPQDAFSNMPSLRTVSLRTNGIRTMEQGTWEGVFQQLSIISMEGNPLVCDSDMKWMKQTDIQLDILWGTCHEPEDLAGVDISDWLDNLQE